MSVEWIAIRNLERSSNRNKQPRERYVMLGNTDINWFWDESQVREFDRLFREGYDIKQLAKYFKRPVFEIALMTIDRDLLGRLGEYEDGEDNKSDD